MNSLDEVKLLKVVNNVPQKHVFADQYVLTLFDDEHSLDEERWISMGQIPDSRILVVVHTYKCQKKREFVRIISARTANKRESQEYFSRRF